MINTFQYIIYFFFCSYIDFPCSVNVYTYIFWSPKCFFRIILHFVYYMHYAYFRCSSISISVIFFQYFNFDMIYILIFLTETPSLIKSLKHPTFSNSTQAVYKYLPTISVIHEQNFPIHIYSSNKTATWTKHMKTLWLNSGSTLHHFTCCITLNILTRNDLNNS